MFEVGISCAYLQQIKYPSPPPSLQQLQEMERFPLKLFSLFLLSLSASQGFHIEVFCPYHFMCEGSPNLWCEPNKLTNSLPPENKGLSSHSSEPWHELIYYSVNPHSQTMGCEWGCNIEEAVKGKRVENMLLVNRIV